MTNFSDVHEFLLARTYCETYLKNKYTHVDAESATGLIENIIRWATKERRLQEVLESAEMMQVTLLVTSITTTTGIVTLLERLQRFNALDLQIAIATAHPKQAQAAGHFGYLLPGVDSVMSLVL